MIIFVTGGSGSGKSEYAENLAMSLKEQLNAKKLYYIAAMRPYGAEGEKRVQKHREQRFGKGFETVENYYAKMPDIEKNGVILLECLSNLTANEVFDAKNKNASDDILYYIKNLSDICKALVIVTNEIFSDGLVYDADTINYIKILGMLNSRLAESADTVFEVVCGIPIKIKQRIEK